MKFLRMLPHLPVWDVDAEVLFYRAFGFQTYNKREGFTSIEHGDGTLVHFGIRKHTSAVPPEGLEWKLEVDDVGAALKIAKASNFEIISSPVWKGAGRWTLILRTPNKYILSIEGRMPDADI